MLTILNLYSIGDILFLKTDPEQREMIVTAIIIRPEKLIKYELRCGTEVSEYYNIELSDEKDVLKSIENNYKRDKE
jgi:hypothetical protein